MEAPTPNFFIFATRKDLQMVQVSYGQLKTCAPTYIPVTIYIHSLQVTPPLAKVKWHATLAPPQRLKSPPQILGTH